MVWKVEGLESLYIQWFGRSKAQNPYKHNGLGGRRLSNNINTMVWKVEGLETLQIHYKYNSLEGSRVRIRIKTMVWEVEGPETL